MEISNFRNNWTSLNVKLCDSNIIKAWNILFFVVHKKYKNKVERPLRSNQFVFKHFEPFIKTSYKYPAMFPHRLTHVAHFIVTRVFLSQNSTKNLQAQSIYAIFESSIEFGERNPLWFIYIFKFFDCKYYESSHRIRY